MMSNLDFFFCSKVIYLIGFSVKIVINFVLVNILHIKISFKWSLEPFP